MNAKISYTGTLPQMLEHAVDQVNAGAIEYQGRSNDARQLSGYLAGGDHRMAEHVATQMIERQHNTRNRLGHSE